VIDSNAECGFLPGPSRMRVYRVQLR
jgi:hypothetical protein